jgi:hypothetical protein
VVQQVQIGEPAVKYPDANTASKPVVGQEAKTLLEAIDSGRAVTDVRAAATIARILGTERKPAHGQSHKQVRRRKV